MKGIFADGDFTEELEKLMVEKLSSNRMENKYSFEKVEKAVDYLNTAAELLDDTGFASEAEVITKVLEKLAKVDSDIVVFEKEAKKR